jgi:UDP-GlcNAc:undecaprenyl-phosphate GlcNAc-1-phosphate transferase
MMSLSFLAAFLAPCVAALVLVPYVRLLALKRGWVDRPDGNRKRHARATPNVGGVAIAASVSVGLLLLFLFAERVEFEWTASKVIVMVGALIVLVTGFYDDVYDMGFKQKFAVQIFVAYLLLHAGYRIDVTNILFGVTDSYDQALYSIPFTLIWIVGILNAVNLIDGQDGLAAGVSIVAFASLAVLFSMQGDTHLVALSLMMIGALVGFLVYNFNPASIFMGDSGSLFIGYTLATCTLALEEAPHANPILALLVPIIPLGLPLLDIGMSIVRRLLAGRSPFAPDRDHIHHRLARLIPTPYAVVILYGVALWFGLVAILMTFVNALLGFGVVLINLGLAYGGIRMLGYMETSRAEAIANLQQVASPPDAPAPKIELRADSEGDGADKAVVDQDASAR